MSSAHSSLLAMEQEQLIRVTTRLLEASSERPWIEFRENNSDLTYEVGVEGSGAMQDNHSSNFLTKPSSEIRATRWDSGSGYSELGRRRGV